MYDECASLTADSRSNSSPLVPSLSISLFVSLSHCQSFRFFLLAVARASLVYPRTLYGDTRERILTDWKPFTTDATPRHATSPPSSSSNVSPFCIP